LCDIDIGFKGGALGEIASSYSVGTCAGEGGGILNFRGRAGGGNVLAGRRLPILRRYGRLAGCLTPVCTSFCVEELEAAQWAWPFFARGDVSPSTETSWIVGYRMLLESDVGPAGATR